MMDGIISAQSSPNPLVGVLFAEDFDMPAFLEPLADHQAAPDIPQEPEEPEIPAQDPPQPAEPEIITPRYSAEDLEIARGDGYAQGWQEGWQEGQQAARAEREEMVRLLLSGIAQNLAQSAADAREVSEACAEATAMMFMQCLSSLLPSLCARHGPSEAAAVARCILPSLKREPRVAVRVNPTAVADMQAVLSGLDPEFASRIEVSAVQTMASGDVHVSWQDGEAVRDSRMMLGQVNEALAMLRVSVDDQSGSAMQAMEMAREETVHGG